MPDHMFVSFGDELYKIAAASSAEKLVRPSDSSLRTARALLDKKGLDLSPLLRDGKLPESKNLSNLVAISKKGLAAAGRYDVITNTPPGTSLDKLVSRSEKARSLLESPNQLESSKAYNSGVASGAYELVAKKIVADKYKTLGVIGGLLGGSAIINYAVKKYRDRKKEEE